MFLDTNVLIEILSSEPRLDLIKFCNPYIENESVYISEIVLMEFLSWDKFTDNDIKIATKNILKICKIKKQNKAILYKTAELRRKRSSLKLPDAIIAATALIYKMPLLTFNLNDFKDIDKLNLRYLD